MINKQMMAASTMTALMTALLSLGLPLMGCSVDTRSQAQIQNDSRLENLAKYKRLFEDCITSSVLARNTMENSKASCLTKTQKSCELDYVDLKLPSHVSLSQECLEIVSKTNELVLKNGKAVECDSGYCTITF